MRENTTTGKMEIYTGAKGWRALQQTGQDVGVVPSNNFNTVLWTSTGNTDISITGVGFKPDLVWAKSRSDAYSHTLYDSVRGAGSNHWLASNGDWTESSLAASAAQYGYLGSFNDDGFTGNAGSVDNSYFNYNTGKNYVSWSWKAGGAATTISGVGTINSDVSANTAAGFSIVKWAGYNTAGTTIAHGLGKKPDLMITKNMTTAAAWPVFYKDAITTSDTTFTIPASTNYWLGLNGDWAYTTFTLDQQFGGQSGGTVSDQMISYCWTSIPGYSLIGSYTGTGSATDTPKIYTGFEPAWLMTKPVSTTGWWYIFDNKRNTSNPRDTILGANASDAEYSNSASAGYITNFYSDGFQFINTNICCNTAGVEYIFMCFAS
jgi:hypothetical protein